MSEKTCGNCDKFVRAKGCEHLGICSEIYFENEYGDDAFAAVRDTRQCDNQSLFKLRTDTLEQRYEKLEQVAKSLCSLSSNLLESMADIAETNDNQQRAFSALGAVTAAGHVIGDAKEKMRELGVIVDD